MYTWICRVSRMPESLMSLLVGFQMNESIFDIKTQDERKAAAQEHIRKLWNDNLVVVLSISEVPPGDYPIYI